METAQMVQPELAFAGSSIPFEPSYLGVFVQVILIGILSIWMFAAPRNGFILLFK